MTDTLQDKIKLAKYANEYYHKNSERINARNRELYHANKERIAERRRKNRIKNIDTYKAKEKVIRVRNKATINAYVRAWQRTEKGKALNKKTAERMRAKYPTHHKARYMLRNAVKLGKVEKKACFCGNPKSQGHHYKGYEPENWYEVQWLCVKHHWEAHNNA